MRTRLFFSLCRQRWTGFHMFTVSTPNMSYLSRIAVASRDSAFSAEELSYYHRHLLLPGMGARGQQKLKSARVLVVGAGGLGCPVLQALTGAGVGRLTIVDGDVVSLGNLARQWLYSMDDLGRNKAVTSQAILRVRNPYIAIEAVEQMLDVRNAESLIASHDLVVDATDDAEMRYLIDGVCAKLDRPWVHGALYRESGQVGVFWERCLARYADLYANRSEAPSCAGAGILGATASMIGNLQASEVIRLITGSGVPLIGALQILDTRESVFRKLVLPGVQMPEFVEDLNVEECASGLEVEVLRQRLSIGDVFRIFDLRSVEQFEAGHLPGASHVAFESLLEDSQKYLSDTKVLVYCQTGALSALLVEALRSRRSETMDHLLGGYQAWASACNLS